MTCTHLGIDLPGQFAQRGGIVDIYAPVVGERTFGDESGTGVLSQSNQAVRIEFFGDSVASIREINLDTQRSSRQIESIAIVSAVCGASQQEQELFVNILPEDTIVVLEEPTDIEEVANIFLQRAERAERLYSWADIYKAMGKFTQVRICRFATRAAGDFIKVGIKSVQRFQLKATSLWAGSLSYGSYP